MELTLYVKPWCPWCVEAVDWLKAKGYPFKCVDVLSDPEAFLRMMADLEAISYPDLGNGRRSCAARF
jgi:glutaredoxin